MFSALDTYATSLKYLGLEKEFILLQTSPYLILQRSHLVSETSKISSHGNKLHHSCSGLLHQRIRKKAKRSLKENTLVVLRSLITKGSWTIVKKREEKWISFKSVVTFPPVQMSIFKESYPLEDESTFLWEESNFWPYVTKP